MSVEFGSICAFKKSLERANINKFLTIYKFPLCANVYSAFRLYFCFYCRRMFVSIALEKPLCFLLDRLFRELFTPPIWGGTPPIDVNAQPVLPHWVCVCVLF